MKMCFGQETCCAGSIKEGHMPHCLSLPLSVRGFGQLLREPHCRCRFDIAALCFVTKVRSTP